MSKSVLNVSLDAIRPAQPGVIHARQNDINSRFLRAEILSDGTPLIIHENYTAMLNAKRSDGESNAYICEINPNGTVTVPLSSWLLEVAGTVKCDLSIYDGNSARLTTTSFEVYVDEETFDGIPIADDENYSVLLQLVDNVSELGATIEAAEAQRQSAEAEREMSIAAALESIETASSAANTAAEGANSAALACVSAVSSVSEAVQSANNASLAASEAVESANTAAQSASEAAESANQAAEAANTAAQSIDAKIASKADQSALAELKETVGGISVETVISSKILSGGDAGVYIINHRFERDAVIEISAPDAAPGIVRVIRNGEQETFCVGTDVNREIAVSAGDFVDSVILVSYTSNAVMTVTVKGYEKIVPDSIPDDLVVNNYGMLVKQYCYNYRYRTDKAGIGLVEENSSYFITNKVPIIKGKDIYIDSTYTVDVFFYDIDGSCLRHDECRFNSPLLASSIPENAHYIAFCVENNSDTIEIGAINTSTAQNKHTRKFVSKTNYTEGIRPVKWIRTSDSITDIIKKMGEAWATGNVDVYWEYGIYDLSGLRTILESQYKFMGESPRGLLIGRGCRYFFNNATLTMTCLESEKSMEPDILDGSGDIGWESMDYEIHDLNAIGKGICYCVHDETGNTDAKAVPVHRKYINCNMTNIADDSLGTIYLSKCIGGGTGRNTYIEIENCNFFFKGETSVVDLKQEVSYHGSENDTEPGYFCLKVHNCYFDHDIGQHWLAANQTADVFICNCSFGRRDEPDPSTGWTTYAWGNTVRN